MNKVLSRIFFAVFVAFCVCLSTSPSWAHFQVILPDKNVISQNENSELNLRLLFTHPFEQEMMDMEKPEKFGVFVRSENIDLMKYLKVRKNDSGLRYWEAVFDVKRPGDHIFYVEPSPYWEEAENKYIIHYAKTVVNAFGMEESWQKPLGLRAEIVPLTRPYGLWPGNVFQGKVIMEGKPLAGAVVEVEYYNEGKKVKAPSDVYVTQVVRTDDQGVFTYAMPWDGWWGFAALADAPEKMKSPGGEDADIELGAVIWIKAERGN